MSAHQFILCCIWFFVSVLWILILSTLDKEWMIDGRGINNICDVLEYLENDDTRDVGVIMTLPLFFPFLWFTQWRKKRGWFMYATALAIFGYWLWQFFLRYQFCW
ncbi:MULTISPECIES: YjeO family protein [Escherichia]|uniref:YjeO family protein n=1 Tax=Escherichia marmotae TaxID=1499973 RepID=A0A7H9KA75_9ESCH|nr:MULTISPECIES: YjeO family protein [Escherichia]HAI3447614.1 YjeO family protein [Escherichia coli]MBY7378923.1 YjeO family protein [Escherichia marmotae]MBY7387025.1 YjeO family protein [Escherichia marmotae]MBY7484657.1 YjeO family protein [Escherichia marmotae]MBY7542018.1 YjeO family protein [Escherichia marmotae]